MAREPARRLFFALWPDEPMREAMVRATREAVRAGGGRPVPADNLHLTLAFLGSIPERRLAELTEIARAEALKGEAASAHSEGDHLELALDRLEYWWAAHLLCALPAEPPAAVAALARRLQECLALNGFVADPNSSGSVGVDITRPFRPHVTLMRKVHRRPRTMEMQPVTWSFAAFVLVDSQRMPEGSVYSVLESFPLGH
jgi:2'-5' RNA ligase